MTGLSKTAAAQLSGYRWGTICRYKSVISGLTSMIGFGEQLTDEEIWAIIQYERTFRRHHGMRGRGPMGHGGMRDSRKSDRGNGAEEDSVATETPSSPEKE